MHGLLFAIVQTTPHTSRARRRPKAPIDGADRVTERPAVRPAVRSGVKAQAGIES